MVVRKHTATVALVGTVEHYSWEGDLAMAKVVDRAAVSVPPASGDAHPRGIGLTSSTGIVVGSIVGAGVFTMPAVMAGAGTSSILVLAAIAVGAMVLAMLFGQLTRRVPSSDGGLYAYSRFAFGDFGGYIIGWAYWIQAWAGNAAIIASWVLYVESLLGMSHPSRWDNIIIALLGLWIPAAINIAGIRSMAWVQNITVVLRFLPLLFVGVVGWFFIHDGYFGKFNASGGSLYSAIGIASGVALFSFIGIETAAITARRVRNPERNVGRASILGTAASAIVYLLVSAVVMGLVPHAQLVKDGAPFVTAFQTMFGHAAWIGKTVAATAVISGFGALVTWTLVTAEVSYAMAQDDLFFPMFKKVDARHTARIGVLAAALLPSILLVWRYLNSSGLTVFVYLVNLSVVLVAIPYLFSASAQLYFLLRDRRPLQKSQLWRDVTLGIVGFLFSMWVTFASGYSAVYQAMVLILVGVPLYALLKNSGKRNSGVEDELAVGGDMALTGTKEEG